MKLAITSIADRGTHDKERIVMKAASDTDVGRFAIFRSTVVDGLPTSDVSDVFWFPDKEVKAGDQVVLYTKPGTASERPQAAGGNNHFYYWGKPRALWTGSEHVPVLVWTFQWEWFKG